MLAERVQEEVIPESSVLDLCAGSGAVAVAAALAGAGEVTAVDVSRRSALAVRLTLRSTESGSGLSRATFSSPSPDAAST